MPPPCESPCEEPCKKGLKSFPLPSTPINVPALGRALVLHPDECFVDYLLTGLVQGFTAGLLKIPDVSVFCPNLMSATREPEVVDKLLEKEVDKGFMVGPFDSSPFAVTRVNPIGVATRKYSGKKRLIIDLSAPHSSSRPRPNVQSINSLIPLPPFSLCYASVDHAISLIKVAGKGAWLSKADITDAFKVMPLHTSQWHLFGVSWRGKLYFSVRLPFGSRSSPKIFDTLSEALCWILLNNHRLPFVLHLLDDFLLIDFPSAEPARSISTLKQVFSDLGVPLSAEKTLGPVKSLEFLGITLDSVEMRASLPEEKLLRVREVMRGALTLDVFTKRDLLSLLGHLNFAMRVIPQGRSFVSRLLVLARSVKSLGDRVVLDEGCRSDLAFWSRLCDGWNGVSFFYNDGFDSSATLRLYTDAAPSVGFGGIFGKDWFSSPWPTELTPLADLVLSTALMELYPIVVASLLWGHLWARKHILFFCDNEATVNIINKGRSDVPAINRFMRRLTWLSVQGNFIFRAQHVPGLDNGIADSLSRFDFQRFRRLCPDAAPSGLECPLFQQTIMD